MSPTGLLWRLIGFRFAVEQAAFAGPTPSAPRFGSSSLGSTLPLWLPSSAPSMIPSPSVSGLHGSVLAPPPYISVYSSASESPSQSLSRVALAGLLGSQPVELPPPEPPPAAAPPPAPLLPPVPVVP